jgi:plasmid stabilization system protein ParE
VEIIWSKEADNDLDKLKDYLLANWGQVVLTDFLEKLIESIELVSAKPNTFAKYTEHWNIRKVVITKHNTLFYRFESNRIEIVRIFDTRQDPNKLKI